MEITGTSLLLCITLQRHSPVMDTLYLKIHLFQYLQGSSYNISVHFLSAAFTVKQWNLTFN